MRLCTRRANLATVPVDIERGAAVSGPAFSFEGPAELQAPIDQALRRVVDPEVAMNIVDVGQQLDRAVPAGLLIQVELVWEPPWTPERLSDKAKSLMGW